MQNSNVVRFANHLAILTLGLGLAACHLPSPNQSKDSSSVASFSVDLPAPSFTAAPTQNNFGIPTAKTMSAEFCAKDNQYNRIVTNHKFTISGGQSSQNVITNSAGCATWKEDISYNHLANPAFVEIQRTITANGYQKGAVNISFAINPWQDKIVSLKDSGVPNLVPKEQSQERLASTEIFRPLWLQNVTVVFSPKQIGAEGTAYSIEVDADPKIILKDLYNQDMMASVTQGQFSVKLTLIREQTFGKNPSRSLISQSPEILINSLTSTQLVAYSTLKAPGGCSLAQYFLGVEVKAINPPPGLQDFHGIFQLGPCNAISNRLQPKLLTDGSFRNNGSQSFSISDFINRKSETPSVKADGSAATIDSLTTMNTDSNSDSGVQKASIQIGQIEAKSYIFKQQSSYIKDRRFYLNFCLTNAVDRSVIPAQPIKVTGLSGQTLDAKTFVDGCVSVEDSYSFNYYSPECWKKQEIRIQSEDLGIDERIPVEINVISEEGPFFRDLRFPVRLQDQTDGQCAKGQTQILSRSFTLDKVQYDYNVDEFLNLQISKTGILTLPLTLNRPSLSNSTGVEDIRLPNGTYTLRWAVVDTSVTDYTKASGLIYSAGEKDVEVHSNSVIIDRLTITLSNIKAIGNTNFILFEVSPKGAEPKNQLSGMKITTFRAPINLSNNFDGAAIETTQFNSVIPALLEQFKADQILSVANNKELATKTRFAKENNLRLLNLKAGDYLGQSKRTILANTQLRQWVSSGSLDRETLRGLCQLWVDEVLPQNLKSGKTTSLRAAAVMPDMEMALIGSCQDEASKDPRKFFDIEYRYLIQRGSKVENLGAYSRDLTINQSFNLSNSYTFNDAQALSADVSGGVRGDKGPFSASAGVRYTMLNLSWTQGKSWGNSINVTTGTAASVETIGLKVRAEDYEKCVVVKLNPTQIFQKTDNAYKSSMIANFIHKLFQEKPLQSLTSSLSETEKLEIAGRGFMICNGESAGRPIVYNENYYVINQKASVNQAMDNSTGTNRPIFVALRGRGDFVTFLSYVENSLGVPENFTADYQQSHMLYDPTMSLFLRGFSTYPGQIISPR